MAMDPAAEIASSLAMEDIPIKLRCGLCSKLALEAVRTPCCDTNICETCYETLNEECPICMHTPFDKTLCTPNKSLRTTIKAFLKKKVTEKETARKKEEAALRAAAAAPPPKSEIDEVKEEHTTQAISTGIADSSDKSGANGVTDLKPSEADGAEDDDSYEPAEPQEEPPAELQEGQTAEDDDDDSSSTASDDSVEIIVNSEPEPYVQPEPVVEPPVNQAQQSFGNTNNTFPNANALQGMNPAMMMAAMAAMGNGFGGDMSQGFPMAPMGMDMNLMAQMAQMMNNMGAMGMGLNGMNLMNMGFNTNQFDQWGNQGRQSYNHNQQFNNHGFQNDFSRGGFRGRGRGRGRGGYNSFQNNRNGQSGYNNRENFSGAQQDFHDANPQHVNEKPTDGRRGSATYETRESTVKDDERSSKKEIVEEAQELKKDDTPAGEGDVKRANQTESEVLNDNVKDISNSRADISVNVHAVDEVSSHAPEASGNADAQSQQGETTNGTAAIHPDRLQERTQSYDRPPVPAAASPPVIPGAPTGPRALREGRGRGGWGFRGRGGFEHISRSFSQASPIGAGKTSTDTNRHHDGSETPKRSPPNGNSQSRAESREGADDRSRNYARAEETTRYENDVRTSNTAPLHRSPEKAPARAVEEDEIDYGYDDDEDISKPEPRARSKHDHDQPSRRDSRYGGDATNDEYKDSQRRYSEHRSAVKSRDRERETFEERVEERSHRYHDRERYEPRTREHGTNGEMSPDTRDRERVEHRRELYRERDRELEHHRRRDSPRAKDHDREREYEDRDRRSRHSKVYDSHDTTRTGTPRSARFEDSQLDSGRRKRRAREYDDEEPIRDERDDSRERHHGRGHGRERDRRDRPQTTREHEREREREREPRERERKRSRREEPDRANDDDVMSEYVSQQPAHSNSHHRDRDREEQNLKPLPLSQRTSRPSLSIRASATKAIPNGPRSSTSTTARERDRDRDREPPSAASVPEKDPHTLEREARNRERLAKEMQRRAVAGEMSLSSRTGGGRDRDRDRDGEDMGTWIRGRSSRTARLH